MFGSPILSVIVLIISPVFIIPTTGHHGTTHAASRSRFSKAHSLGDSYEFDPRDGWQHVNVTNMQFARPRKVGPELDIRDMESHTVDARAPTKKVKSGPKKAGGKGTTIGSAVGHVVSSFMQGLKGIGRPEPVTITWYTGHDLLNPSCWSQSGWHPTDASFACALTMDGWTTRPKCFKFLELCNSPKKCVFVRVVDTCAGCAAGSKHVDLTRAAFGALADFAQGSLTVQLRPATEPKQWHQDLWGPKA